MAAGFSVGSEGAEAAVRGGLQTPPSRAAVQAWGGGGGLPCHPLLSKHGGPRAPTAPHCIPPPGTAALGSPCPRTAPLCLSFSGLAGFARLCPGDQYEVRLHRFMVCLSAKEWQISAGFYIVVNKAFLHQHPEKQLLFFLYML